MSEQDIEQRWRAQSTETPGERIDTAIRAAARRNVRRRPAWSRYAPLAAAASVGVIAILLVRQSPHEDPTRVAPIDTQVVTEEAVTEDVATPTAPPALPAPSPATFPAEPPPPSPAEAPAAAPPTAAAPAPAPPAVAGDAAPTAAVPSTERAQAATELRSAGSKAHVSAPAAVAADAAVSAYTNGEAQALPARLVELITADAAAVADVDPQDVEIVSWEAVTWSDGSLGCRTRGEMAIQVLTPGYRVQVLAGGQPLVYHTDRRDLVRLCRTVSTLEPR